MAITASGDQKYLWREAFLTEPVGRWVSAAGHSFDWSLKRSDEASLHRVQRRASGNCQPVYRRSRPLPFSRSIRRSSPLLRKTAQITTAAIAIAAVSIQPEYAYAASNIASICTPFDPDVVGFKLVKLIGIVVLLNVLLTVIACHLWGQFLHWAESRVERGAK